MVGGVWRISVEHSRPGGAERSVGIWGGQKHQRSWSSCWKYTLTRRPINVQSEGILWLRWQVEKTGEEHHACSGLSRL